MVIDDREYVSLENDIQTLENGVVLNITRVRIPVRYKATNEILQQP